ncbi:16471_t:CDS:1 [Racocetra persica]|uniref:16471_t:CDS:1 n=1 Tax=Racocetra persica TaxID=160502 RepID=A0ACA9L6T9_9GLOM|nr:16471_t:CDS:1 [Racocetra persica]
MEAKEIAHSRGGMCLSTEYINLRVLMQWMCDKGHKWFASFNGIKHAKLWCPYCLNKHENLCSKIVTKILSPPSDIRRPDFLKTPEYPRRLELDIYYPQYGFAIEVQGKQHKQYVKYFHKSEKNFGEQLIRDQLKRELCDENWTVLIDSWYYEDPYIIIPEYLKGLGLID